MNIHHLISYPLYAGGILEVILGIALLKQASRTSRAMQACAALFFAAAGYVLCTAASYTLESRGQSFNFFNRASWVGWFMIPACLQFVFYMQDENSRAARIVGAVLYPFWSVVLALTLFTDLVEPGDPSLIPFVNVDGPLEKLLRLVGSLMLIWVLAELYRTKNQMTGLKKAQFDLFFFGTLFFDLGGILVAGILPLIGAVNPALASFFSLPWVVITYYAITRRRFFDLRLFLSRVLAAGLVLALLALTQVALFGFLSPVLGHSLAIAVSLFALGALFFATRINRTVQQWIQHLVLKDRYEYQDVLRETARAVGTILDLGELLDYIISGVKKSLGVENIYLLLRDKAGQFFLKRGENNRQEPFESGLPVHTLLALLQKSPYGLVREELESMTGDGARKASEAMRALGAELVVPLVFKGGLKGFIVLGRKGNRHPYFPSDIELLEALAGHAVIALENASLFEESRLIQASLEESEKKFRTLADTAAMAIFIHRGANFLYANRAAEVIGGYGIEEYLSMNFMSLVHPAYVNLVRTRARERLDGSSGVPSPYEFKILRKNGEERWVLMTAGITEFDGKPAVIGTLIDITARKTAEEERERYYRELQKATQSLKESEARFRTLTETTAAAIVIHRGGRLLYTNPAVQKVTGYTHDEFPRMEFWEIVHPDFRELVQERGRARLQGKPLPEEYEFKIVTKRGEERWVNATAGVVEYEDNPAVIATLFDITDRKRAEEEKEDLFEARIAEEKRHLMEKEKILMDLHDGIGGITTNISMLAELGRKAPHLDDVKKTLGMISRLSHEGMSEIRCFLQGLDTREISWRTLAAELRNQGTGILGPHNISFDLKSSMEEDCEQPGSLLWVNLIKIYKETLTNVVKHANASSVAVALQVSTRRLLLSIQDNGNGGGVRRGNGRGLANMRRRAEELGGTVDVASGQGTRVRIEIPLPIKYPDKGMEI